MATILLTGGRAPVTLELARLFHRAGHRVLMAESLAWHLSRPSAAVAANFRVPPPRQDPGGFTRALAAIVRREGVDLLVPTCEEIYAVARGRADLEAAGAGHAKPLVLAEPLEKLRGLHDKWRFAQRATALGLRVPAARRLESAQDLRDTLASGGEWVLKPVFSRFAARTRLPPHSAAALARVRPSPSEPWVAQAFLRGRQVCTYSLAHHGQLAAHAAYPVAFSAGQGAAVAFRAIEHAAAQAWVARFVRAEDFTGQIAFDFIENAAGEVAALECNPRATSGAHLLARAPGFASAFFGPLPEPVGALKAQPAMLAAGMLLYALPATRSWAGLRRWAAAFARSRDVVFNGRDPLPGVLQLLSLIPFAGWSLRHHISLLAASTYDIEWNGGTFNSVPVLVTGATGFLGGALARRLALAEGACVTALGRRAQAGERLIRETQGGQLRFVPAELAEPGASEAACAGQAIVFHCAARAGAWGRFADFQRDNVIVTQHVIAACRRAGSRLVYVSTPSVCFANRPRLNVSERDPLPARQMSHYAATKLLAEQAVTAAAAQGLPAISIRPRAIFGPRDTTLLPRLIQRLAAGRLPILGDGRNLADLTYVENVVDALLLCAQAPAALLGRTFHITNGEPARLWAAIGQLCQALGYPLPRRRVPLRLALALAGAAELAHTALRRPGEPALTRYGVRLLALDATLDISAARRDLGYAPRVSLADGLARLAEWWQAGQP